MPVIKIDENEYELDLLPPKAKQQLMNLQFVDAELQRLKALTAVMHTARATYGRALKDALLETPGMPGLVSGTVQ